ncbi:MAG: hypothetical protein IT301_06120 [Dehalococcoidia bacterium]|nr:hypothetical protein [Dehalococcoidia bacterium]
MKRALLLGFGAAALFSAAAPAMVSAQNFPPPPPTTFYGKVPSGIGPGDTVIAIVTDGTSSQVCGDGTTTNDASGVVYVVDVVANAQTAGCGQAGRTVQFYFVGAKRLATDTATWSGPGPANKDLTNLGAQLSTKNRAPQVAKDGSN